MDPLDPIDVRVLGALIEKEITTPDNYPLSLNALRLACNQSSNRDPVMQLDDEAVIAATDRLRRKSLLRAMQKSDSRVMKYNHLLSDAMNLEGRELAIMCVLMLRGPQTVSELRTRASRMADFAGASDVETTLAALSARDVPLAQQLARRPGQKEVRYAHLLSGEASFDAPDPAPAAESSPAPDRIAHLESAVEELRNELVDVRRQLEAFRKQFE